MLTNDTQKNYIGIDFGTTNIAVASRLIDYSSKKVYPNTHGEDGVPFPAIMAISPENKFRFGRKVKTQVASLEDEGWTIIKSIKSDIGGDKKFCNNKYNSTQVVKGLILAIKRYLAQQEMKLEITTATIAVPIDFSSKQRRELKKAFTDAGINVRKIISESTAAYIRNRNEVAHLSNVMVFDWGGGTLDLSLLNVSKDKVYETATMGWKVAGDKIDEIIAEYVHNQIVKNPDYNVQCSYSELGEHDKIKILSECEKAKIGFSDEDDIDEPAIISMVDYCGEKKVRVDLEYSIFEDKIKRTISEAVGYIQGVLNKANKTISDLDAIIMVGGSCGLLPLRRYVQDQLEEKYKIKIVYPNKVQWSVAEGAAIIDSIDCAYAINQSIDVVMCDGLPYPIIPKGSTIPYQGESITFGTVDNATSANFIFADENDNLLARMTMPAKGFLGESFSVSGTVESDLVALIKLKGNFMMNTVGERSIEIGSLSFYYDISHIDEYSVETK